jgi:hypothetical protein
MPHLPLHACDESLVRSRTQVMEVMVREGIPHSTQEFLLDDFMKGFLYALFRKKWDHFGWYVHFLVRVPDAAVVAVVSYLAVAIKYEAHGGKGLHTTCTLLAVLILAFAALELFIGSLYAFNFKSTLPVAERVRRTWAWMKYYAADINSYACALLLTAILLYTLNDPGGTLEVATEQVATEQVAVEQVAVELVGEPAVVGPRMLKPNGADDVNPDVLAAERAAWHGIEPLEWLFFGLGFLLKFFAFVDQAARPYTSLSTIVIEVIGHGSHSAQATHPTAFSAHQRTSHPLRV